MRVNASKEYYERKPRLHPLFKPCDRFCNPSAKSIFGAYQVFFSLCRYPHANASRRQAAKDVFRWSFFLCIVQ